MRTALTLATLLLSFAPTLDAQSHPAIKAEAYGKLPLSFEANRGQTDPQVRFLSRGNGYSLFLTDTAAVLSLRKADPPRPKPLLRQPTPQPAALAKSDSDVVRMELAGASHGLRVEGADQLPGTANYFIGNDPAKWHSAVPTFAKVRYTGVYPGVDLVYYGNQSQLEYDFVVAPHADPKPIRLHFAGARKLKVDSNGNLEVIARNGQIAFHKPVIYQQTGDQRQPIEGTFTLLAKNTVSFTLGTYDHDKTVVIDPTLAYSTYLAGSAGDYGGHISPSGTYSAASGIAVDPSGNAYLTGGTNAVDFPVTAGAYQTVRNSCPSPAVFVSKLNPAGSALLYSTYICGTTGGGSAGINIALDALGDAFITGLTYTSNFPVTPGAFQSKFAGTSSLSNAFVVKLNPSGTALIYSSYLGGSGGDAGESIAVDALGFAYLTGETYSKDFPVTAGALQSSNKALINHGSNAWIAKFNFSGTGMIYSTYLGGSGLTGGYGDAAFDIKVDTSLNAYITGATYSISDFPTTPGAFQTSNGIPGTFAAFVSKLDSSGATLDYSTYFGGTASRISGETGGYGIAVDGDGNAYVTGHTLSTNLPTTPGAFQSMYQGSYSETGNAFVAKFNATGTNLIYMTYLGGAGSEVVGSTDFAESIAVDGSGNAYVTGATPSANFPVTCDGYQVVKGNGNHNVNAFLTELNAYGSALVYSSYLGGTATAGDSGARVGLDPSGNAYIVGTANSGDFPITNNAFQKKYTGVTNGPTFVAKFGLSGVSNLTNTSLTISSDGNPQNEGTTSTFTAYVLPDSCTFIPTGTVTFTIDGTTSAPIALNNTGRAAYSAGKLAVGNHLVLASYSGSPNYAPSSNSLLESVVLSPAKIALISGSAQSSKVGTAFSKPLVVQLSNVNGIAVPNATVSFAGAGMTFSSTTAETNSLGQASVTATPVLGGILPGSASVTGTSLFVSFTETGVATVSTTVPTFASMSILATGASAAGASLQAAVADFNGDGYADLATTNTIDATVSVLLSKGNGTFKAPVNYPTGNGPYGVATGDFNGDGKPALAVVNGLDATVSILLNTAGTFPAAPSHTYAVGLQPYGVSVADLNRDGAFDLVVTNNAANTLSVLLGNGDGTFKAAVSYATGSYPFGTSIADFNNDGYPDLAVWNYGGNTVGILLNTGAGSFTAQTTYPTGADPFDLATGDFNGDGYPDIAVANLGSNTVSVLLNNKSGGFLAAVNYATGSLPTSALAVDLNGDGVLDLATTNLADGTVSILLGKGDGTFLAQTTVPAGTQPYALQAADFNGDGRTDLAVSNFFSPSIGILLQTASTTSSRVKTDPPRSLKTVPIQ